MFGVGLKSKPDLKANSEQLMCTDAVREEKKIRCAAFDVQLTSEPHIVRAELKVKEVHLGAGVVYKKKGFVETQIQNLSNQRREGKKI